MSQQINDNFKINAPKPMDQRFCKFVDGASFPYASVSEANSIILSIYRYIGMTVLINDGSVNKEYWYKEGTDDLDLVVKSAGKAPSFITGADVISDVYDDASLAGYNFMLFLNGLKFLKPGVDFTYNVGGGFTLINGFSVMTDDELIII